MYARLEWSDCRRSQGKLLQQGKHGHVTMGGKLFIRLAQSRFGMLSKKQARFFSCGSSFKKNGASGPGRRVEKSYDRWWMGVLSEIGERKMRRRLKKSGSLVIVGPTKCKRGPEWRRQHAAAGKKKSLFFQAAENDAGQMTANGSDERLPLLLVVLNQRSLYLYPLIITTSSSECDLSHPWGCVTGRQDR